MYDNLVCMICNGIHMKWDIFIILAICLLCVKIFTRVDFKKKEKEMKMKIPCEFLEVQKCENGTNILMLMQKCLNR